MILTAEDILKAQDSDIHKITVPQWGGDVYIRVMSGQERDEWEQKHAPQIRDGKAKNVRATLAAICLCDESGNRLFDDKQVDALGKKSAKALDLVFSEIQKVNALTDQEIDDLEKNS